MKQAAIRWTTLTLLWVAFALSGNAATTLQVSPLVRRTLVPTGSLRVALYVGTPTSLISEHDLRGVGYELGQAFAHSLGVSFKPLVFSNNAGVLNAMKSGRADVAFTNATTVRARYMDFTESYLTIELGYLARAGGPSTLAEVDRPGVRVGVTANSTSE